MDALRRLVEAVLWKESRWAPPAYVWLTVVSLAKDAQAALGAGELERVGVHRGCGGDVVIADQALLCQKCHVQNWTAEGGGPYDEDLHEKIDSCESCADLRARLEQTQAAYEADEREVAQLHSQRDAFARKLAAAEAERDEWKRKAQCDPDCKAAIDAAVDDWERESQRATALAAALAQIREKWTDEGTPLLRALIDTALDTARREEGRG